MTKKQKKKIQAFFYGRKNVVQLELGEEELKEFLADQRVILRKRLPTPDNRKWDLLHGGHRTSLGVF